MGAQWVGLLLYFVCVACLLRVCCAAVFVVSCDWRVLCFYVPSLRACVLCVCPTHYAPVYRVCEVRNAILGCIYVVCLVFQHFRVFCCCVELPFCHLSLCCSFCVLAYVFGF